MERTRFGGAKEEQPAGKQPGEPSLWEAGNKGSIQEWAWRPLALEPAGTCPSSAHSRTQGMLLGTAGSSHSLSCFLDFEEPLDDFLGFFIRWYFRASSLSGAAASPGGDGRFLEGKADTRRQRLPATLGPLDVPGGGSADPSRLCRGKGRGEKPGAEGAGPARRARARDGGSEASPLSPYVSFKFPSGAATRPVPPATSNTGTPSSPACHANTAKQNRTGQILCPIRHFWEVVGNPLGWRERERQAEAARQRRDGHHEPPEADNTGATNSREAGSCWPCSHSQKNQGPHDRQGHQGHTPTEPGQVPRSQVPVRSDNRNATARERLLLEQREAGSWKWKH